MDKGRDQSKGLGCEEGARRLDTELISTVSIAKSKKVKNCVLSRAKVKIAQDLFIENINDLSHSLVGKLLWSRRQLNVNRFECRGSDPNSSVMFLRV